LIIRVQIHEFGASIIDAQGVKNAGMFDSGARLRQFEPVLEQYLVE